MLWARILADLVVVIHALYVAFVVLGMAAILIGIALGRGWARDFWFRVLHLLAIGVVVAQEFLGIRCPFTAWENALRARAGQATYPGAFLGYWAHRLIFVDAAPWAFTLGYCLFGLAVLVVFVLEPPHWPGERRLPGCEP
jgi:hypothetical protein